MSKFLVKFLKKMVFVGDKGNSYKKNSLKIWSDLKDTRSLSLNGYSLKAVFATLPICKNILMAQEWVWQSRVVMLLCKRGDHKRTKLI